MLEMTKYSFEKFVSILEEIQAGATIIETCNKHKVSTSTYYRWINKYSLAHSLKTELPRSSLPMINLKGPTLFSIIFHKNNLCILWNINPKGG